MCTTSTDSNGHTTESCSTCYETHYTVKWWARTTVGNVTFQYKDSTSRSVYNSVNPQSYVKCEIGEPAAIEHSYTNYVQAVPQSLFHDDSKTAAQAQYAGKVPSYPRVHSFYKYNRVINVDSTVSADVIRDLDAQLDDTLKQLGHSKQVNIIVIMTEIDDPTYRYAIENAWLGGEKNDVIVMLGLDGNIIKWADVMTWALNSGNELFHVTLRDSLLALGTVDATEIATTITTTISSKYDRPHMKDYEYLAKEVTPANWVIILAIVLSIGLPIILTFVFHRVDVDFFKNKGYNRRRRFR